MPLQTKRPSIPYKSQTTQDSSYCIGMYVMYATKHCRKNTQIETFLYKRKNYRRAIEERQTKQFLHGSTKRGEKDQTYHKTSKRTKVKIMILYCICENERGQETVYIIKLSVRLH